MSFWQRALFPVPTQQTDTVAATVLRIAAGAARLNRRRAAVPADTGVAGFPISGTRAINIRSAAQRRWRRGAGLGLAACLGASGAMAQPAAAAIVASAPQPAASNPAAILPQWAQDRLAAAQTDPKLAEKAYAHGAKLAEFCANCHGPSGQSVKPEVPNLAGQNTIYVLNQLNKFHDGQRRGAYFMEGLVKAMSNDERFAVAVYYTRQRPQASPAADAALAARGKAIYEEKCKKCHGADGVGSPKNSRIASQHPQYLDLSLRRYRANDVRSDERMLKYTKALTDADIAALAAYVGALP